MRLPFHSSAVPGPVWLRESEFASELLRPRRPAALVAKRLYDLVLAGIGFLLLSPVLALLAVGIKLADRGPVFYWQRRIGRNGQPFDIWKFRSMVADADQLGPAITQGGDARITPIGRFLRATKLDELPQLWNVLTGDMSLVGPRPEVPRYVERYTPDQRRILECRPGITDLATLRFRGEEALLRPAEDVEDFYVRSCLPRKIALNLQYAQRANLFTDTWIILQTLCPAWLAVLGLYALVLGVSLWLSFWLRFEFRLPADELARFARALAWIVPVQTAFLAWRRQGTALVGCFSLPELRQTAIALGGALVAQVVVWRAAPGGFSPSLSVLLLDFVMACFGLCAVRLAFRLARERRFRPASTAAPCRVAIIGAGEPGASLARRILREQAGATLAGFFDDDARTWHKRLYDVPVLGMPELLLDKGWAGQIDLVLLALSESDHARLREIEGLLERSGVRFQRVPSLCEIMHGGANGREPAPADFGW